MSQVIEGQVETVTPEQFAELQNKNDDLTTELKGTKMQMLFAQRQALQAGIVASQYQLRDVEAEIQKCQQPGTITPTP